MSYKLAALVFLVLIIKSGNTLSQNPGDSVSFSHFSDTIQVKPSEEASIIFRKAIRNIRKHRSNIPFVLKGNYYEDISENDISKRKVNAEVLISDDLKAGNIKTSGEDFIIISINKQNIGVGEFPELTKVNHLQRLFKKNPLNNLEAKHFRKASFKTDSILRKGEDYFYSISFFSPDLEGHVLINSSDYAIQVISIKEKGFTIKLPSGDSLYYIPGIYSANFKKNGEHYFISHLIYTWGLLRTGNNESKLEVKSEFYTASVTFDSKAFSGGKIMDKTKDLFIQ